jgi:hypothetical protein
MRNFQTLDTCKRDTASDSIEIYSSKDEHNQPRLAMRREGIYVTISSSYGPLEIALRLRYEDLVRMLSRLIAVEGLHTTREVGTGQAYLALGLTSDDALLLRPTIVADATGHFSVNLKVTSGARKELWKWLDVPLSSVSG